MVYYFSGSYLPAPSSLSLGVSSEPPVAALGSSQKNGVCSCRPGGREGRGKRDSLLLPCPRTRAIACSVLAVLTAFGPYLWETVSAVAELVAFPGEKGSCHADGLCSEVATAAHWTSGRLALNKQAQSCLKTTPACALILQSYFLPGK